MKDIHVNCRAPVSSFGVELCNNAGSLPEWPHALPHGRQPSGEPLPNQHQPNGLLVNLAPNSLICHFILPLRQIADRDVSADLPRSSSETVRTCLLRPFHRSRRVTPEPALSPHP